MQRNVRFVFFIFLNKYRIIVVKKENGVGKRKKYSRRWNLSDSRSQLYIGFLKSYIYTYVRTYVTWLCRYSGGRENAPRSHGEEAWRQQAKKTTKKRTDFTKVAAQTGASGLVSFPAVYISRSFTREGGGSSQILSGHNWISHVYARAWYKHTRIYINIIWNTYKYNSSGNVFFSPTFSNLFPQWKAENVIAFTKSEEANVLLTVWISSSNVTTQRLRSGLQVCRD